MRIRFMTTLLTMGLLMSSVVLGAQAQAPTPIEIWVSGAYSEAAGLPADWIGYKIIREKLNINLKVTMLPSSFTDMDTKINTAAAANRLPDVLQINRLPWNKLVKAGLIAQLDPFVPLMPNAFKILFNDPVRKKIASLNGKLYAFASVGTLPGTDGLVIRKDWLDKLKLPVPKTIDELVKVAKAFTEQDPDGNGKADTYGFGAYIDSADLSDAGIGRRFDNIFGAYGVAGVWNLNNRQSFGLNVRSPNYKKALTVIKTMSENKWIDPEWATLKKDDFRLRWKQGKFGIMRESFSALWGQANYQQFDDSFPKGEWIPINPPKGPDGKTSSQGLLFKDTRLYGVSARAVKAGKTDAIARLFEWFSSDEGYYLCAFGQKDINYKTANGEITLDGIPPAKAYRAREVQPYLQIRFMVFRNTDPELRTRYLPITTKSGKSYVILDLYKQIYNQPWTDATVAQFINAPANAADFLRNYNEGMTKFVLGQSELNDKTWSDYLAGLDKLGARELEAKAKAELISTGMLE